MSGGNTTRWENVSPNNPCPICGKPDFCSHGYDQSNVHVASLCRREQAPGAAEHTDSTGVAFYILPLTDAHTASTFATSFDRSAKPSTKQPDKASPDTLNRVYSAMLSAWGLSDEHRAALHARGFTDAEIERLGYRTINLSPSGARTKSYKIARGLIEHFTHKVCYSVPGFTIETSRSDSSKHYPSLALTRGIAIPVRDLQGRIIAIKMRKDEPGDGPKYIALSSRKRQDTKGEEYRDSPTSGVNPHIPLFDPSIYDPQNTTSPRVLRITEGEFKADYTTLRTGILTLSVPGARNWLSLLPIIKELAPDAIRIAYDADHATNKDVAAGLSDLISAFDASGIDATIGIEVWDTDEAGNPKGIDDLLVAGGKPRLIVGDDVETHIFRATASAKAASRNKSQDELDTALSVLDDLPDLVKSRTLLDDPVVTKKLARIRRERHIWGTKVKPLIKGMVKDVEHYLDDIIKQEDNAARRIAVSVGGPLPAHNGDAPQNGQANGTNGASPHMQIVDDEYVAANAHSQPAVRTLISDAPVDDTITVPPNYTLTSRGVSTAPLGPTQFPEPVCGTPILIDHRYTDVATNQVLVSIRWKRGSVWKKHIVPRATMANARKLIDAADFDLPVDTMSAGKLARYLSEFDLHNQNHLPESLMSTQLGWQGDSGKYGFLVGEHLATTHQNPQDVKFHANDYGDQSIASSVSTRGDFSTWLDAITWVADRPRVVMLLYASFAAPLLQVLDVPNFVIDVAGMTSRGKTEALRIAASVWGNPDESAQDAFLHTWDNSPVWVERAASTLCHLPLILDDTKRMRYEKQMGKLLYNFTSGHGRGRGSIRGTAASTHWKSILLSTGETRIVDFTNDGGTRARCLSIWSPRGPFDEVSIEMGRRIKATTLTLRNNYGVAGRRFIEVLQEQRDHWPAMREYYAARQREYLDRAGSNNILVRMADFFAVLHTTASVLRGSLGIFPGDYQDPIGALWDDLESSSLEADRSQIALEQVLSWAFANEASFINRDTKEYSPSNKPASGQGWAGQWGQHDEWDAINFYPHKIEGLLETFGYDKSVLRIWADKGWLNTEGDKKRYTKKIQFDNQRQRMVSITKHTVQKTLGTIETDDLVFPA